MVSGILCWNFFRQNYHLRVRSRWTAGCAVFKSAPPGREELNRRVGAMINVSFERPGYQKCAFKCAAFLSLQVFVTYTECGCHITKPVRRSAQISLPRTLSVFAFTVTHIVRVTAKGATATLPIPSSSMLPARWSSKQQRCAERNTRRKNPSRMSRGGCCGKTIANWLISPPAAQILPGLLRERVRIAKIKGTERVRIPSVPAFFL